MVLQRGFSKNARWLRRCCMRLYPCIPIYLPCPKQQMNQGLLGFEIGTTQCMLTHFARIISAQPIENLNSGQDSVRPFVPTVFRSQLLLSVPFCGWKATSATVLAGQCLLQSRDHRFRLQKIIATVLVNVSRTPSSVQNLRRYLRIVIQSWQSMARRRLKDIRQRSERWNGSFRMVQTSLCH